MDSKNRFSKLRTANIILFFLSNIVVAKEFQNYFLAIFFGLLYFINFSKQKFLTSVTILLLITTNLAWETLDHRGLVSRPERFFSYFPTLFSEKIILNMTSVALAFLAVLFVFWFYKKNQSRLLYKNTLLLVLLSLVWIYIWSEKGPYFYFLMTSTLLITTFLIRYMQLYTINHLGFSKIFHLITPPFFDYAWSVKSVPSSNEDGDLSLVERKIFNKLLEFFVLFYGGKFLTSLFFTSNFFNGALRLPSLQSLPPQIILDLLATNNLSKFELLLSLTLFSLLWIGRILSLILTLEAGYLLYGFKLRSDFKFFRLNTSFSQYIYSLLYPVANLHKDLFIYPWLIQRKNISKFSFYSYVMFSVVIFSVFFHTFTEFDVMLEVDFSTFFHANLISCLIYTSLLMLFIYIFRRVRTKNIAFLISLNIFYVFLHGCLLYIRSNFLYTDPMDKLKVIASLVL